LAKVKAILEKGLNDKFSNPSSHLIFVSSQATQQLQKKTISLLNAFSTMVTTQYLQKLFVVVVNFLEL